MLSLLLSLSLVLFFLSVLTFRNTTSLHRSHLIMAFRATRYWRSMLSRQLGGNRSFATSTTPKMKLSAPTVDAAHTDHPKSWAVKGEFAPVYMVMGMLLVAMSIGAHTAKQQLVHSPSVRVSKKRRKSIPEVEDPDRVVASADKFVNKSFLRKVAHIQEHHPTLPHPAAPHPFTRPRHADTLKSARLDPGRH